MGSEGPGHIAYQAVQRPQGKTVEIWRGLRLKLKWMDRSGNHFTRTSRRGTGNEGFDWTTQFSAVKRIEAPMTEEEIREAYEDDEVGCQ